MDKIWLKHYPKGVPAEIDVNEYASVRDVFDGKRRQVRRRVRRITCMGKTITFARARHAVGGVRRVAAGERLQQGHARRADDAQHPAVSGVPVRHAARRLHGGQRQSALHGARARAPAQRLRRRGDRRRRELRAHACRKSSRKTKVRQVIVTSIGELLGFKGIARRLRAAPREEDGPGVERCRARSGCPTRSPRAGARTLERVPLGHDDIAFLQYTGGTTGVAKGAMLLHRNIVANLLQARAWVRPFLRRRSARSSSRRCRSITSSR